MNCLTVLIRFGSIKDDGLITDRTHRKEWQEGDHNVDHSPGGKNSKGSLDSSGLNTALLRAIAYAQQRGRNAKISEP
jgi:hypothetical protein